MSNIRKFDYSEPKKAKYDYSENIDNSIDNEVCDESISENVDDVEQTNNNAETEDISLKELIRYEKKYKKLNNFGVEKIYIPLSAVVIIGTKTLFPNFWGISIALIGVIYLITKIVVEYKLEKYVQILGYTPESEPSKVGKLFQKLRGDR